MGISKAIGILALSVQAVVGADYYIQTRDAGMRWGELSAADYSVIIQDRFAKAHGTAKSQMPKPQRPDTLASAQPLPVSPVSAEEAAQPAPICVRRGTTLDCQ